MTGWTDFDEQYLSEYDMAFSTDPGVHDLEPARHAPPTAPIRFEDEVQARAHQIRVQEAARALVATENRPAAPPFDLDTLDAVLQREKEPPFRIAQLAPAEGSHLISAMRKTGKTTFALNICKSLLDGSPFLGEFEVTPVAGDIAFLNFEVAAATVANWARQVGVDRHRLHLVNLRGRRNPLAYSDDRERLGQLLKARSVEALFVDPFTRAFTGDNQNDASQVGGFLNTLDTFARTDVGAKDIFLTAHTGWNDERSRGSSELEGWADSIIRLLRGQNGDPSRYIKAEGRDVDLDEQQLQFDPDSHRLTLSGFGSRVAARDEQTSSDLRLAVLEFVKANPGSSGEQIRIGVGGQNAKVVEARTNLVQSGDLVEEPRKGKGGGRCYRIPNSSLPLPTPPDEVSNYSSPRLIEGEEEKLKNDIPHADARRSSNPTDHVGEEAA